MPINVNTDEKREERERETADGLEQSEEKRVLRQKDKRERYCQTTELGAELRYRIGSPEPEKVSVLPDRNGLLPCRLHTPLENARLS